MDSVKTDDTRTWPLWRIAGWSAAGLLLLAPAVAMQFTSEVRWGPLDFLVAAFLIGVPALLLDAAIRASASIAYRLGAGVALAAAFLMTWSNLAVGIIGDEGNPANLMFFGVVGLALAGALVARFRARGMAIAMAVTGGAQLLVGLIAFDTGMTTWIATGIFAAAWFLSAGLFGRAAGDGAA